MRSSFRRLVLVLPLLVLTPALAFAADRPLIGGSARELFEKGGLCMYPILLGSVIGLACAFERSVALRRGRLVPRSLAAEVRSLLSGGRLDAVRPACEASSSPLGRVLIAGLRRRHLGAPEMEKGIADQAAREIDTLRRNVRILSVISTITPLLGLLGTVFGMIAVFNAIGTERAMGNHEKLAAGIGEALLTTAAGLSVAIPFVLLFHWFNNRIQRAVREWEALATELVDHAVDGASAPAAPAAAAA